MADVSGQSFVLQADEGHGASTSSSRIGGVLQPLPLSILALSAIALASFPLNSFRKRYAIGSSTSPVADALETPEVVAATQLDETIDKEPSVLDAGDHEAQGPPDKKRRSKDRRRRGKDLTKEWNQVARGARAFKPNPSTTSLATTDDSQLASSSALQTPRPKYSRAQSGSVRSSGLSVTEDAASYSSNADDDDVLVGTFEREHRLEKIPTLQPVLALSLPLAPSSRTTDILCTLSTRADEAVSDFIVDLTAPPVFATQGSHSIEPISPTFPNGLYHSSSASASTSTSISGTFSTIGSSALSPQTPPSSGLIPSISLPVVSGGDGYRFGNSYRIKRSHELSALDSEDHTGLQKNEFSGRLMASASDPAWDRSLDWGPAVSPSSSTSNVDDSWVDMSPSGHHRRKSGPTFDILFPSLNDPPVHDGEGAIMGEDDSMPRTTQIASLKGALEAARIREERWKMENDRLGRECQRLNWSWAEDMRKWNHRESELQNQIHQIMTIYNMQLHNQLGGTTPMSATLPSHNSTPGANGKRSSASSSPSRTTSQIPHHAMLPMNLATPSFPFGTGVTGGSISPHSSRPSTTVPSINHSSYHKTHRAASHSQIHSRPTSPHLGGPHIHGRRQVSHASHPTRVRSHHLPRSPHRHSNSSHSPGPDIASAVAKSEAITDGDLSSPITPNTNVSNEVDAANSALIEGELVDGSQKSIDEDTIPEGLASAILKRPESIAGSVGSRSSSRIGRSSFPAPLSLSTRDPETTPIALDFPARFSRIDDHISVVDSEAEESNAAIHVDRTDGEKRSPDAGALEPATFADHNTEVDQVLNQLSEGSVAE